MNFEYKNYRNMGKYLCNKDTCTLKKGHIHNLWQEIYYVPIWRCKPSDYFLRVDRAMTNSLSGQVEPLTYTQKESKICGRKYMYFFSPPEIRTANLSSTLFRTLFGFFKYVQKNGPSLHNYLIKINLCFCIGGVSFSGST